MTEVRLIDPERATNFEEFWPWYLSQHLDPGTRRLHVVGTLVAAFVGISGILRWRVRRVLAAPVIGYAFAWAGHFGIEKNKPATIGNPVWSFQADWRLVARTLSGTIESEVSAVRVALSRQADDAGSSPVSSAAA